MTNEQDERASVGAVQLSPWIIVGGLATLVLVALTFRPVVEGDGVGYYSYLHAIFVSRSLQFDSEYSAAIASHVPVYLGLVTHPNSSGGLANFFPIGSAILASPLYLAALALSPSGVPQYGPPFVDAFAIASLCFGLMGLGLSYRLAVIATGSRRAALLATVTAAVGTSYLYYLLADPSYSHTFSVFCVSAFLYVWWVRRPESPKAWFALGILGGVMAITRFQDVLVIGVILADPRRLRPATMLLLPGILFGLAPQIANDYAQFGSWVPQRPPGQDLNPLQPHVLDTLFSSRDGLFVWTPAAALATLGWIFIRDRTLRIAFAIAVVLETAVIVSAPDTVGRSFGPRRFLDLLPFAVVSFAAVATRIGPRLDWAVLGVFCLWNVILQANFEYVMASTPTTDYSGLVSGQVQAIPYLPRLFTKGAVVRQLVLWRQTNQAFDPLQGLSLLLLEAISVAAAFWVAIWSNVGPARLKVGA